MEKASEQNNPIQLLLDELLVLMEEYDKALHENLSLGIRKELRLRIKEVQKQIKSLREKGPGEASAR